MEAFISVEKDEFGFCDVRAELYAVLFKYAVPSPILVRFSMHRQSPLRPVCSIPGDDERNISDRAGGDCRCCNID